MHIDFCSAIDNARHTAAREETLRRNSGPTPELSLKSSRWNALRKEVRAVLRDRSAPKASPAAHAH